MKVIYVGLFTVFILMSIFLTASVFGLLSNSKQEITTNSLNPICLKSKLYLSNIIYMEGSLSFDLVLESDSSDINLDGINIRSADSSEVLKHSFQNKISNGDSIKVSHDIDIKSNDVFFISPKSCSSSYEKLCYISKGFC